VVLELGVVTGRTAGREVHAIGRVRGYRTVVKGVPQHPPQNVPDVFDGAKL
jgi:hypothetical protein